MAVDAGVVYVDVVPDTSALTSRTGALSGAFGKMAKLAGGVFAVKQIADFAGESVKAAEDAKRSQEAFHASLERTGQLAGINEDKFNDWLQSMGESIGQDDEDLRDLATSLTSVFDFSKLTGDPTENLMKMSRAIQDVSAATQKSAGLVKRAFITMANDPAGALLQFQKLGVLTEEQVEHYTKMADKGKDAAVTQILLNKVSKQYAGAAAANTTASEKLHTIWENLKESLGNFLLPLFEAFVDALSGAISWLRDFFGAIQEGGTHMSALGDAFSFVLDIGKAVWSFFKDDLLKVWNTIVDVVMKDLWPALQDLWDALKAIWKVTGPILKVLIGLQLVIIKIALKALPFVIKGLALFVRAFAAVFKLAAEFVAKFAEPIIEWLGKIASWLKDKFIGAWRTVKDVLVGLWRGLSGVARAVWNGIAGIFEAGINGVIFVINKLIDAFNVVQDGLDVIAGPTVNFEHVGHLSNVSVPRLAQGGIVTRPTLAMVGEAGPEAVIPLSQPLTMRVVDWRNGIVELSRELDWSDWSR